MLTALTFGQIVQIMTEKQMNWVTVGLLAGTVVNVFVIFGPLVAAVYLILAYTKLWWERKRQRSAR